MNQARIVIPNKFGDEKDTVDRLTAEASLDDDIRERVCDRAVDLIKRVRSESDPTLMEHFLTEYGLSTQEGVALMCLAEAMLRVPDTETMEALIEDKIAPSDWGQHLGTASSSFVNASTWALMLTGKVLDDEHPGMAGVIRGAIKRVGEPVIRVAVGQAMKQMGRQFVLGESIAKALSRARDQEAKGYSYSYDMLGEAAITQADADRYAVDYETAIDAISLACHSKDVAENPGISIKLSALHPRYEVSQEDRILNELVPVVLRLAKKAKAAGMGFNIDAEEQDRLVLSLKVIRAVLASPDLSGWNGFGVVVQAYGKRASYVLDWLYETAQVLDRRIMVRLVKGAYWDTEMKHAQVEGLPGFPLFTTKPATDVSFIANEKKLFDYSDRIYPQFATHNAHTVSAILEMADGRPFEFQRLHGMGESLHHLVLNENKTRCRIYAPVGRHKDLLAYLVRRLLENGANSSFVHQIVDEHVSPEDIATDPFEAVQTAVPPNGLIAPDLIFGKRVNSKGFDLTDDDVLAEVDQNRSFEFSEVVPKTLRPATGTHKPVLNPFDQTHLTTVLEADEQTLARAIEDASVWSAPVVTRAKVLRQAADLYEANAGAIFEILAKEAGKTLHDAVGELREAVDFLRYYADEAEVQDPEPAGIFAAISPWNFPLAIFTGQIAAALAVGTAVIAKPAEATPAIASFAVDLLHQAGVPTSALQLVPGQGGVVGAALTSDPRISGVVFTGSTETALRIRRTMAQNLSPSAPFIAETGGLNAMIVDSTALPEQAVTDIVTSAFQSAGQRCSALRCLYVQRDIAEDFIALLQGAMDELRLGDPWDQRTDIGPIIDAKAHRAIAEYISKAAASGAVLHQVQAPSECFIGPTLIKVKGITDLDREVFGPVLHVATFENDEIDRVIDDVNGTGFGLTFGLHTRIDGRVQEVSEKIHAGNVYVNRNQIGAIVGSQPFGGEGLSGTGPKAGGPNYLSRFAKPEPMPSAMGWSVEADISQLKIATQAVAAKQPLSKSNLPGPTGEENVLSFVPKAAILCAGPGEDAAEVQARLVRELGGNAIVVSGHINESDMIALNGINGVVYWGEDARDVAIALSQRDGPILPLITGRPEITHVMHERHLCVDTTASGGNAALLAG